MTYEQLRVFQAIVAEGTFRGAAAALNKSQPAVSATVRNLEAECGFALFSRDAYRPALTREGRVFYDRAASALREMGRLSALAGRLSGAEEPLVEIAVNNICPLAPLLGTLREIDARFPATQINLSTESLGGAMARLADGRADIAVTTETGAQHDRMELQPFTTVRIVPVATPDYPPARAGRFNTADDMRPYAQIVIADSDPGPGEQTLNVLQDVRRWVVSDIAAKKEIVMAGMGWGGLPEHEVAAELADGRLVRVHVEEFDIRVSQLYAVRRTDRKAGIVAEALWQALRKPPQGGADAPT